MWSQAETTPVIIITGMDEVESINRACEVGVNNSVAKPVSWEILRHRTRYIVRAIRCS